jgi:hypothetical protein
MTGQGTWWRRLGGGLVALVLCVLTLGPNLDLCVCAESPSASVNVVMDTVTSAASDFEEQTPGHGACQPGTCHHCAPCGLVGAASLLRAQVSPGERHVLLQETTPRTDLQFGLIRPPRA